MSSLKRVINVIPLTRVNLSGTQIFTYLVPSRLYDQLRPGHLVAVPFGARTILGIASSFERHRVVRETRGLKEIEQLVSGEPALSERMLALANWVADYYVGSLGLVIKAMLPKFVKKPKPPELIGYEKFNPDFILTEHQRLAVSAITNSLGHSELFLLHGVTGSGKTEVYFQIIARVLESGKQAIVLVPEISLTVSAVEKFARRFGLENIALVHSQLKASERFFMWQKIKAGSKKIIIGPRSAIFVPVQSLGLIIIDEEHDASFKQFDQNPKYDARVVAKRLSQLWSCPLIFGDATPSVEAYSEALSSELTLLTLPFRIKADAELPKVQIVNMKDEIRSGNFSIFSQYLKYAILNAIKQKKQIILYLNRRGSATFVMCRDCGFVARCPNCATNLVWHKATKKFLCHRCGKESILPTLCPNCQGTRIKHFGLGTQSLEEETLKLLRDAYGKSVLPKVARMDSDTTQAPGSHDQIYQDWSQGKTDILVGTQILARGWDIGRVGLVGIISADNNLYLPDFRSNERTFQMLTQVAGRTGRGAAPGLVILQTYHPENYAIAAVRTHNYQEFFKTEIREREKFGYPPFVRIVKLTSSHKNADRAENTANLAIAALREIKQIGVEILGPAPAFIPKVRGKYQFQIFLKIDPDRKINLYDYLRNLPPDLDIDVDPESLL